MPFLHRNALVLGAAAISLLLSLAVHAAAQQGEPPVPVRSLAAELAAVDQGTPAYIHTHYATGIGVLLPSRDAVVTARHNVLTPSGSVADEIAVGIAQMPLHNVVEVRVLAAAQDPAQDLVLLRPVRGLFPPAEQQTSSPPTEPLCTLPGSAPCPPAAIAPTVDGDRRPRSELRARKLATRAKRSKPRSPAISPTRQRGSDASPSASLHVVWDGPAVRKIKPGSAPPTPSSKRRIVEDGPLPTR